MAPAAQVFVWAVLACAVVIPVAVAATSPLLEYRSGVYILSGIAGAIALSLLLVQPLLAGGYLPGLKTMNARWLHRLTGMALVIAVALHVGGLYLTSPPDALDALMLVSPTPFSVYGVIGMWAVILIALLAALRGRMRYRPWRIAHNLLALTVAVASIIHALLIEGTMGGWSKWMICACIIATIGGTILHRRIGPALKARRESS